MGKNNHLDRGLKIVMVLFVLIHFGPFNASAEDIESISDMDSGFDEVPQETSIYDPIEPFNRVMFQFNDNLYFVVLKPVARGYSFLVPVKVRVGVRRFFSNITTPIRLVNSLLQFRLKSAGIELSRFAINTTIGLAGFMDPARERWKLFKHEEDLGQTLGLFGAGPGLYIVWPVVGPSSMRDTVGMVGDFFLNPTSYISPDDQGDLVLVRGYDAVIGDYWQTRLEDWTYTNCGCIFPEQTEHYQRIASFAPEALDMGGTECLIFYPIKNLPAGVKREHSQCAVVDVGFLELVRYGIRGPLDPHILKNHSHCG